MPQSLDRKLHVRFPEQRIFFSSVQLGRVVSPIATGGSEAANIPDVQLLRLPRLEALCDLLRKTLRIARRSERLFRQNRGCLVMSVPAASRPRKSRDQPFGPKRPDHSHDIAQGNVVSLPLLKSLLRR